MKTRQVEHKQFGKAAEANSPVARLKKQIDYMARTGNQKPEETQRREKEIRREIAELRKLAAKRPISEAGRLNYDADQLLEMMDGALGRTRIHFAALVLEGGA